MNSFQVPTRVVSGEDAFLVLKEYPIKQVCIVCDPFVEKSGMLNKLLTVLDSMGAEHRVFSDIQPNPDTHLVAEGVKRILEHHPDAVIAVGGGSAIDVAKAMSFVYQRTENVKKPLCVAIPTTSGTGSEVTGFSVITDSETHSKHSLVDASLLPNLAILDPSLVKSVPAKITADTGMDVLTHAVEAYVSTECNDFTEALAEKSAQLIMQYLPVAVQNGANMDARTHVHNASCMAGIAFNHASLGICHSIAHILGARFNIPHGRANAMVLCRVIAYNAGLNELIPDETCSKNAAKYAKLGHAMGVGWSDDRQTVHALIATIQGMKNIFGIPDSLKAAGVDAAQVEAQLDDMARVALADTCTATNPRSVDEAALRGIIRSL